MVESEKFIETGNSAVLTGAARLVSLNLVLGKRISSCLRTGPGDKILAEWGRFLWTTSPTNFSPTRNQMGVEGDSNDLLVS